MEIKMKFKKYGWKLKENELIPSIVLTKIYGLGSLEITYMNNF